MKANIDLGTVEKLVEACKYTLQNLDTANKDNLITAPKGFQIQLGESARLLREALAKYETTKPCSARPLPKGTVIEFCGEQAVVENDDGGSTLSVNVDGCHQRWHWRLEEECKVISLPEVEG